MTTIKRSESISLFLEQNTWSDLAVLYNRCMEVQVNVARDNGESIDKFFKGAKANSWTDGIQTWGPFRIPYKAMLDECEDNDFEMRYDLALHVDGIGMTGWDWVNKRSIWVAFDFDSIIGHKEAHSKKLTEQELNEIKTRIEKVEWVTIRKSTGGNGLHLYVFIDQAKFNEPINNHNEHSAVGRAILSQLSAIANFDFSEKVDVNAGNMWVWHRKMILPNGLKGEGLKLLKSGTKLDSVPKNWRDYLDVMTGKRRRTIPFFIKQSENPDQAYDEFEELSNQRTKTPLDNEHNKLLNWIEKSTPGGSWWQDSHWMLVTHTSILKQAHTTLGLKGIFETIAEGTQFGSDHNCFSGETLILTRGGHKTLKQIINQQAELKVWNGKEFIWKNCEIKSFGIQKTVLIRFDNNTEVRATFNHRWPYYKGDKRIIDNNDYKHIEELRIFHTRIPTVHGFVYVTDVIYEDIREEEVFCAIVPEYHNFVLAGEVITLNCFGFPMPNGAWSVRRYTKGTVEHPSWFQDGITWTYCYFNRPPDLKISSKINSGIETKTGGYAFDTAKKALEAARLLGVKLEIPEKFLFRPAILKEHKDKRLIIEIQKEKSDNPGDLGVVGFDGTSRNYWSKILDVRPSSNSNGDTAENLNLDKVVRHIVNEGGQDEGWVIKGDNVWRNEPLEHIKYTLKGPFGYKPSEVDQILGTAIIQPYILVNRPFDIEYPPGRLWNRKGAKYRFERSQNVDNLEFPTWLKILNHIGNNLTPFLKINPWAISNNIKTGADYLILWIAAIFQQPYARSPYLFLYSEEENTGKSTLHEAISKLLGGSPPNGYMKVNEALKANQQFNAELQHAILCVVEELDLNPKRTDAKISNNRIKELVTAEYIGLHEKNKTPNMVLNTTHWCQCSNDKMSCPIFKNDSRITMIKVDPIDEIDIIPRTEMFKKIEHEAPDFLTHILSIEIPQSNDRLIIPALETEDKKMVQNSNLTLVEQFIRESCHIIDGATILWAEFYTRFSATLEMSEADKWTKKFTGFRMPEYHPRGRRRKDNQYFVANLSFDPRNPDDPILPRLILRDDYLTPIDDLTKENI